MAKYIYNSPQLVPSKFRTMNMLLARIAFIIAIFIPATSRAFPTDFYASSSVLDKGHWVKIRVESSGMHRISNATLRSWGFTDPAKVRIHGYGGRRITDLLSTATYVDDLPETMSVATDVGVVFYAAGPDSWELSAGSNYHGYLNPYSNYGYYFITETDSARTDIPLTGRPEAAAPSTTAQGRYHYETETLQATPAGPLFVGEDFQRTRTRNFVLPTPKRTTNSDIWMECVFMHVHKGATASLTFKADNVPLAENSTDRVPSTADTHYSHGSITTTRHSFSLPANDDMELGITYTPAIPQSQANLDYVSVNYPILLSADKKEILNFWSDNPSLLLTSAGDNAPRVWDVTDPNNVMQVNTASEYNETARNHIVKWSATEPGMRAYVSWVEDATFPSPTFAGRISNQNIHGTATPVDMVIITPAELMSQANRIAELHRKEDGMEVTVVDQEKIYNEFSSGTYDVGGLRKYLKFIYDKSADTDHPLKYALLLGRTTLDHRAIQGVKFVKYQTTPWWVVREPRHSMTDNDGFGTDDFIAMLEDNSGTQLGLDILSIAVGRIPMLNASEGEEIIDKLEQYQHSSKKTGWKNRMMVLADDEDGGVHHQQAESMVKLLSETEQQQHVIDKVYIDAYEKVGHAYPTARREMFRILDDGVAWWIYAGHANNHSWTGDGMLTYSDINNMYLRNLPFVLAATCDFLRWDGSEISGGEIMYKERYGGSISMISATRPVYISDNALFLNAFGRQALSRDDNGQLVRSGEAYRRTKNDIRNKGGNITSNTNRLRFVFMGDPAMAISTPSNIIEVTAINGVTPDEDSQVTIGALGTATIEGRVTDPYGQLLTDFNGVVNIDIYDADYSMMTLAHGDGIEDIYDRHGDKLFSGSTNVESGLFTLRAAMPSQIADNFRQATMSLYAYATNSNNEAIGLCRDFYVYGLEEPETPDNEAPRISSMVLNHAGFSSGDAVNPSPMMIAKVEDNIGINLSLAGIGQQMHLTLDDFISYDDVASYYTPSPDGSPSGTINYPLEGLSEGAHTLKLRVFDTSGNSSAHTIEFFVSEDMAPSIFELFTDANPATTSASFYVRHDRPDTYMEVSVTVYNLLGQPLWTGSAKGMSEMDVSAPVVWNLCDGSGHRVQRGIYLYRATITTDNERYETASQRIAVTAE